MYRDIAKHVGLPASDDEKAAALCSEHYFSTYIHSTNAPLPDLNTCDSEGNIMFSPDPTGSPSKRAAMQDANMGDVSSSIASSSRVADVEKEKEKEKEVSVGVAGYMPLRCDFDVEHDNDAELILADMEFREVVSLCVCSPFRVSR